MTPNPYVGPRAFKDDETLFGRDQELKGLLNLLIARRIVLLYSLSGAGKTSLIQAALIRKMKDEGFRVLPLMRPGLEPPPEAPAGANRYLLSVLMSLNQGLPPEKLIPLADLAQMTLADFLKRNYPGSEESGEELLIFDQFEEILTHDPTDVDAKKTFFEQVGEVLQPKNRWALFAMREEYVAGLDPYRLAIPTRLLTTFRLDLLGLEAARQAIQEPVRMAGGEFTDAAAEQLVKDLSTEYVLGKEGAAEPRAGLSVEPVQLQVVCQRLWQRYGEDDLKIDKAELQGLGDVNTALADFYAEQVAAVTQGGRAAEKNIRDWVQTYLISERGFREQVMKGLGQTKGLDNQAIQVLVDANLVRQDSKGARTYYELSHDRLIEPVRENNEAWFRAHLNTLQHQAKLWNRQNRSDGLLLTGLALVEAEEWAEANEPLLQDHERAFLADCRAARARLERERQSARRIKNYFRLAAGLAILSFLLFVYSCFQTREARVQTRKAEQQARVATAGKFASSAFSQLHIDPERSILLALEAVKQVRALETKKGKVDPEVQERIEYARQLAKNALHRATFTSRVEATFPDDQAQEGAPQPDKVSQVFFSPDRKRFATISQDKTVKIWDAAAKGFLHPPDKVEVIWASFNQDGSRLAMACKDKTAKIWDVNKKEIKSLEHDKEVLWVYFNKQGTYLATVDSDDKIRLWDGNTFTPLLTTPWEHEDFTDLAFSPDGKSVATAGWDGDIFIGEVGSKRFKKKFMHGRYLKRVTFSPNGTLLATVCSDGKVKVWHLSSPQKPLSSPVELWWEDKDKDFDLEVAFSSDDKFLALTGKYDYVVRVLNISTKKYQSILPGHTDTVSKLVFLPEAKSPNGRFLVSASEDNTVKIWNISTNKESCSLAGVLKPVMGIAVDPDPEAKGNRLVSVGWDGKLRHWDIGVGHTASVNKVVFDHKGARLATASNDGTTRVWDTKDGNELLCLRGDQERPNAMAFSLNPDKDELVTASNNGTLTFWTDAKKPARRIDCNEILRGIHPNESPIIKKIDTIAFSPSGKYAVVQAEVGFKDRQQSKILLFNPEKVSSSPKLIPPRHMRYGNIKFGGLAISPGENQLALGLSDGRIQEWDLTSTKGPIELWGHQDAVFSVAYSPTGDYLASAGADMKVKLWKWNAKAKSWDEVKNKDKKAKFSAFDDAVVSVAFSHDGKLLAAGSNDRTAKVFDLHGRMLHSFSHPAGINDVAFSRDDKNLAAACDDGRWYTHPLDLEEAEAQAQKQVTRKLTQDECEKFGMVRASTPDSVPSP